MPTLSPQLPAWSLEDVALFDLAGALSVDRPRLVQLLENAHHEPPAASPSFERLFLRETSPTLTVVDLRRPVHVLADLLTMAENARTPLERISVCYVGDGESDLAESLLLAGALIGMDVRIAAPRAMWPHARAITAAQDIAADTGARLLITPDAGHAVLGAHYVVAGSWGGASVLAGAGDPPPAYRVDDEFVASSQEPATRILLEVDDADLARQLSGARSARTLHVAQTVNRRRVMAVVLADRPRGLRSS